MKQFVYFVRAKRASGIKVGLSSDPHRRIKELQAKSPIPLELIGFVEGTGKLERAFHERFADRRRYGEWFKISPSLRNAMNYVLHTGSLP